MFNILVGCAMGGFILFMRVKQYHKSMLALQKAKENHTFQVIDTTKSRFIFLAVALVATIVTFIYAGFIEYSESNFTIAIVLLFSFVSEIFSNLVYRRVYYDDESFFFIEKLIRYRSVKGFKKRRFPFSMDVVLINGEVLPVPTKPLQIIQEKMVAEKEEKKNKKRK